MLPHPLRALLAYGRRRPLHVVWDEAYRLPLASVETGPAPLETRRADDALHYLLLTRAITEDALVPAPCVSFATLAQVHTEAWLEALQDPATLAHVFALDERDVVVDELLRTIRIAVGGTLAATHATLRERHPAMNLFGGFHHAAPGRGAGFCALNDMAVALATLRADGFTGMVGVIDFDFHPPDGTAECLQNDPRTWIGSLSGANWGPLPRVDETVLPPGTGDGAYLEALDALLGRMPPLDLVYVVAGGDVLAGDRLGTMALSLQGIRERDRRVAEKIAGTPQVWLPAGGYGPHAWKVVAGSGLVLAFGATDPIPNDYDPLASRMRRIARTLSPDDLGDSLTLTEADVSDMLGLRRQGPARFLGFYTAQGLEFALERYRLLPVVRRLGFDNLHLSIDRTGLYDRARLHGRDLQSGEVVTLIELECERRRVGDGTFVFVNWLSLRNPRARFNAGRPQLPGQEVPGLGLAREMTNILSLMARRLSLDGVAFRPSWYHMAFTARHTSRFVNPARQGRFEALLRDLHELPLLEATRAVAEGRVLLNGSPYQWEADEMVAWLDPHRATRDQAEVVQAREASHFTIAPVVAPAPRPSVA